MKTIKWVCKCRIRNRHLWWCVNSLLE